MVRTKMKNDRVENTKYGYYEIPKKNSNQMNEIHATHLFCNGNDANEVRIV